MQIQKSRFTKRKNSDISWPKQHENADLSQNVPLLSMEIPAKFQLYCVEILEKSLLCRGKTVIAAVTFNHRKLHLTFQQSLYIEMKREPCTTTNDNKHNNSQVDACHCSRVCIFFPGVCTQLLTAYTITGPEGSTAFQCKTTDTLAAIYFSDRTIYGPSLLIIGVERKIA